MCWSWASQASWLVGQSVGAYLNRFGDPRVPSAVAGGLYVVCFVVASATLPTGHITQKKTMKRQDTTSVLTASRAVAATAGARLAVAFAMRAAMVTRQVYELERWDLSRSDYASFGLFKSIMGIAASFFLAGPLSRRFCQGCGTEHLVKGAAAVAVVAALAEAVPWQSSTGVEGLVAKAVADPSLLGYACVIFPLKTAAGQVATIALRARFTEVVPASDTAGALAALDVASSAIGVAAPIVGGFAFDGVPVPRQPLVAAAFYGAAFVAIVALFAFEKRPAAIKED